MDRDIFWRVGNQMTGHNCLNNEDVGLRRFIAMFGVTPSICSAIWNLLESNLPQGRTVNHLLWALLFLKNYCTEETNRAIIRADEKTIRKWVWLVVQAISRLKVVCSIIFSSIKAIDILKFEFFDLDSLE